MWFSFILKINGRVDIKFDDFEDVKDHPYIEPFMHTFQDVFEKVVGDSPENALTNIISLEDVNSKAGLFIAHLNIFLEAISAMLQDENEHVNIKIAAADFPFAFEADIESECLG